MEAISSLFDETDLVICAGKPRAGGIALPRNARVIPLPNPPGVGLRRKIAVLLRMPSYIRRIGRSIRSADAVHTPVPGDISLLGMLSALILRKPLVVRYCGSWNSGQNRTVTRSFTQAVMEWAAGGRNVMLATGSHAEPPAPRMHWIFTTAMTERDVEALRPTLDRGLGEPARLVYAGRLTYSKRVDHLLTALGKLRQDGVEPVPHLTVIGDGPERKRLEELAMELGIAPNVEFAGQLGREALSKRMLGADVYVHASLSEGMCKAWLDAMAHGLPVVAYEVGGAPSILGAAGERGWFVPVGDVDALTRKLQDVLSEPLDWPAIRRRCREYARTLTLDSWGAKIGGLCAESWGLQLREGKLRGAG
jgi:glycosyltransferase involved in cell wall biosynthesis